MKTVESNRRKFPVSYRKRNPAEEDPRICGAGNPNRNPVLDLACKVRDGSGRYRLQILKVVRHRKYSTPELEVRRSNLSGEDRKPEGARTCFTSVAWVEAWKGTDSNP
jgi:hypothetical protein